MNDKTIIQTDNAPQAIGAYSQAVRCGNLVFISGQIPLDPKNGEAVAGDAKRKSSACFKIWKPFAVPPAALVMTWSNSMYI